MESACEEFLVLVVGRASDLSEMEGQKSGVARDREGRTRSSVSRPYVVCLRDQPFAGVKKFYLSKAKLVVYQKGGQQGERTGSQVAAE